MEKSASLDLEQFESSDQQDRLNRARRQVTGRTAMLGLVFGQVQDLIRGR
jgi:ATP-binding cassette subfamily B protein